MAFLKGLNVGRIKETLESGVKSAQESVTSGKVNEAVKGAKDAAAAGLKKAQDSVSNINVDEVVSNAKTGIKSAQESIANIKPDDIVNSAKNAASSGAAALGKAVEGITKKEAAAEADDPSYRDFIALLWCLAYIDGVISDEERKTLDELSSSIDAEYDSYSAELEQEYNVKLTEASKEFGFENAVKIEAQNLVAALELSPSDARLLCWNLFAIANSDGLDDSEVDLIRFIGEKANVDAAVIEEFRNYSDAIVEIGKETELLKQSNRSYAEIEPLVNELAQREQVLIEAAQSLVADK